jgi:hypothetical protein
MNAKFSISKHGLMKPLFGFLASSLLLACSSVVFPFSSVTSTPKINPENPPATSPEFSSFSREEAPFNVDWDDRSLFRQNLTRSGQTILAGLPHASIYHVAISIGNPPTRVIGMVDVRYINDENVGLNEVDFAVFPEILGGSVEVTNLTIDGRIVFANHHEGLLRIPLIPSLKSDDSVIIHLEFEVSVPERGGDYYYGIFGYNDGILSLAHCIPTILVYNQQGWNNQTPDLDGDPLFSDASFYLVTVDAPADLVLVASGSEVTRSESTGRQRILYANGPARDFYLAAGDDLIYNSQTLGEVTINSYTLSGMDQSALLTLDYANTAIADFSDRYSPYPYTEFDIVPITTTAGGVEFPGMTSISRYVYPDEHFLEVVVVHEVGHQWFYNLVGNATQNQPWLDESMAEFLTWQYYLDRYGSQAAEACRSEMQSSWDLLNDELIPIGLPVSGYSSEEYSAIVYGRGPLFILALREKMGMETFDSFLRNYSEQFRWAIASTTDFKNMAELECGCDLSSLFNSWILP